MKKYNYNFIIHLLLNKYGWTRGDRCLDLRRPMAVESDKVYSRLALDTQERSTIRDTAEHGCSGGTISELIYYADTSAFYEKYQDEIWRRLGDMADDLGEDSILHLIATFNGAKDVGSPLQLKNLLAWWAAEEVCRGICMDWDDEDRATA